MYHELLFAHALEHVFAKQKLLSTAHIIKRMPIGDEEI
jgi:hypothetical protein